VLEGAAWKSRSPGWKRATHPKPRAAFYSGKRANPDFFMWPFRSTGGFAPYRWVSFLNPSDNPLFFRRMGRA